MARHIIIPVRLASTRLRDKALLEIAGKPMIEHVYHRAKACNFDSVTIAADHPKVADVAESFGAKVCMTKVAHPSGTDRIAEAAETLGIADDDIIVNIQGDEPLIPKENVKQVALLLEEKPHASMATLCEPIHTETEIFNPHAVKLVFNEKKEALYFSRAPIPWQAGVFDCDQKKVMPNQHYRHIGLYAYRANFLKTYTKLAKSPLEQMESLEQLRVLWHGYHIAVDLAQKWAPPGVDTLEDLEKVRKFFNASN